MSAHVEIYTRRGCGYCDDAKSLLRRKDVSYREINAGSDASLKAEMIKRAHGGSTFPQIFVDGRHIGGCDDMYALEARGELDPLLFPASSGVSGATT